MSPFEHLLHFVYGTQEESPLTMGDPGCCLPPIYRAHKESPKMANAIDLALAHIAGSSPSSSTAAAVVYPPSLSRPPRRINPLIRKGRWTKAEDERLLESVAKHGPNKWKINARDVQTRTSDQCWKRWNDSLDPSLNHGPWTPEEDEILEASVAEMGRLWSKIATENLNGRSGLMCKNRWDHLERRRRRSQSQVQKQMEAAAFVAVTSSSSHFQFNNNPPQLPSQGFHVGALRSFTDRRDRKGGRFQPYLMSGGNVASRSHPPIFASMDYNAEMLAPYDHHSSVCGSVCYTQPRLASMAINDVERIDSDHARLLVHPNNIYTTGTPHPSWSHSVYGGSQPRGFGGQMLISESHSVPSSFSHALYDSSYFASPFGSVGGTAQSHSQDNNRTVSYYQY